MAKLTSNQLRFLESQQIAAAQVFDASSCTSAAERKALMEELELYFFFGGAKCRKAGHSLRDKANHCIQCDTSKIAFQLRSTAAGFIYLAHSASTNLIKVGFTKNDPHQRIAELRKKQYANASDWKVRKFKELESNAGKAEFVIHAELTRHRRAVRYQKTSNKLVECREVFDCDLPTAIAAFNTGLKRWAT